MANIGMAYADMKRFEEAVSYFKQSAPVLLETGDKLGAAKLLSTTGQYYETIADYRAALDFFEKCLRVAADIHDNAEEARARRDIERVRAKLEPPAPRR
jgi:tetratricopeptide (TPR) repeat protein